MVTMPISKLWSVAAEHSLSGLRAGHMLSQHITLWKSDRIHIAPKLPWKKCFKHTLARAMGYMNMMGHQAIKECFNIELVCTVKWREMEFLGDKFLPSSVQWRLPEMKWVKLIYDETRIFHFSHSYIKKELANFRHCIAKNA